MTNKIATIEFTRDDLVHPYGFGNSCPIFQAMKRAGVPVHIVMRDRWIGKIQVDPFSGLEGFSRGLCKADKILERTTSGSHKRNVLIGKKFVVKWKEDIS